MVEEDHLPHHENKDTLPPSASTSSTTTKGSEGIGVQYLMTLQRGLERYQMHSVVFLSEKGSCRLLAWAFLKIWMRIHEDQEITSTEL